MAMRVSTRLWLGGVVRERRELPLSRAVLARVRRRALPRVILFCTDGLCSYVRAIRETFRDPGYTGQPGRPRWRAWKDILIAQVVTRYEKRRVVEVRRRIVQGPRARVEAVRRRSQGCGGIKTAYIERIARTPAMATGITDHCWTMHELLSFQVPPPRWTPPRQRGRRSRSLQLIIERWCT